MYIPLLDNINTDLKSRLGKLQSKVAGLSHLIPSIFRNIGVIDESVVSSAAEMYTQLISEFDIETTADIVRSEYDLWIGQWSKANLDKLPKTAIESFNLCNASLYPTPKQLLKILCTLPVTVASAERSFSCVRRLKTWMRSRMTDERLTGLAACAS